MVGDELFRRKIPKTLKELEENLRYFGATKAAEWFKEKSEAYGLQELLYPHQIKEKRREVEIPEDVVIDVFRAVPLNDGERLYKDKEIKIAKVNVHDLYTLQKLIFKARVEYFEEMLDNLPEKPALLIRRDRAAIYMPPIVEVYEDGKHIIIDGVHRSYAKGKINGSFGVVLISTIPYSYLPAKLQGKLLEMPLHEGWTIPSTSAKFDNLKKEYFRMYNYLGFGKGGKKNGKYV